MNNFIIDIYIFFLFDKSGGSRGSENVHRSGTTVGEQMRIGYRKSQDDIPMDHREESEHDAVRREFTRGHAYGLVERNKTRD